MGNEGQALLSVLRLRQVVDDMLELAFKSMPLGMTFQTTWVYPPREKKFLSAKSAWCYEITRISDSRWKCETLVVQKKPFSKETRIKELYCHLTKQDEVIGFLMGAESEFKSASYPKGMGNNIDAFGAIDFLKKCKDKYHRDHVLNFMHKVFEGAEIFSKVDQFWERELEILSRQQPDRKLTPKP